MDRAAPEYSQSDQASAAQYPTTQDVRPGSFSASATPTSEYSLNPSSARSSNFPEYLTREPYQQTPPRYHPGSNSGSSADPSIAASSPTYPAPGQYSPYPPQHDMAQAYPGHPGAGTMYGRPDWGQYGQGHPHGVPPYSAHASPSTTVSSASSAATAGARPGQPTHPLSQVYSFVPIPGSQQHKRPRRRYEEIERMYKCGYQGCEKAYGTLNHLNAHVTMQGHGTKRTPEQFKEIRKEWKARKKEEENARKADEDRQRLAQQATQAEAPPSADPAQAPPANNFTPGARPHLPPLAYTPGQPGQPPAVQGQYPAQPNGMEHMQQQYGNNPLYPNYPQAPYGAQGNQMYQQRQPPLQGGEETDADAEPDPDVPAGTYPAT